jgi:hypothetical protein
VWLAGEVLSRTGHRLDSLRPDSDPLTGPPLLLSHGSGRPDEFLKAVAADEQQVRWPCVFRYLLR